MGFHKGNKFGGGRSDNRGGGGRGFDRDNRGGGRGFGGGRRDHHSEMHPATCSDCGNSFELPFRPSGERPVFCNNCFHHNKDGHDAKSSFKKSGVDYEKEFAQINRKLDKIMKLYEFITGDLEKGKKPFTGEE